MRPLTLPRLGILIVILLAGLVIAAGPAAAVTYPNANPITIVDCCEPQNASPSPLPVVVSGMGTSTTKVTATLTLTHGALSDVDLLLVAPTGQKVLLLSDTGISASGTTITLDDGAAGTVPAASVLAPGTYKPTDGAEDCTGMPATDSFPGAPAGSTTTTLSSFNGADPNGTWNVYAVDDCEVDSGSLPAGITLNITAGSTTSFPSAGAVSLADCCIPTAAGTYPSTISVAAQTGPIQGVSVKLKGLTHPYGADLNAILEGPGGQSVLLLSDAGRAASGATLTFNDAGSAIGAADPLTTGIYKPTNLAEECATGVTTDPFPGAAPASPSSALSVFNGTSPNGTWKLWLVDDCGDDAGQLATGWELDIATDPTAVTLSRFSASRGSKGVTLRWKTAQEARLLGFNVYRAQKGKLVKVNRTLVAAKGKVTGAAYSFLDRKAPRSGAPSYRLQAVGVNGKRVWLGSARLSAKRAPTFVPKAFLGPLVPPIELQTVCALEKNGSLRYAANASACRKKEDPVTISPGPTQTCYQADGSIRKVASAACPGSGTYLALPPTAQDEFFCGDSDGRLRRIAGAGPCGGGETLYVSTHVGPLKIDLDPDNSGGIRPNFAATHEQGHGATLLGDPLSTITNSAGTTLSEMDIVIGGVSDAGKEKLNLCEQPLPIEDDLGGGGFFACPDPLGSFEVTTSTVDNGGGTFTVTLTDSGTGMLTSDWQDVLRTLAYENIDTTPTVAARTFVLTAKDGATTSSAVTSTISVIANTSPNTPPVATDDAVSASNEDQQRVFNGFSAPTLASLIANDTDADNDTPLVITAVQNAIGGSVSMTASGGAATSITFTPTPNYNGPVSFDYTLSDNRGGTDTGTVSWTINPVADIPVAVNDTLPPVLEDSADLVISAADLLANDTDADNLSPTPANQGLFVHFIGTGAQVGGTATANSLSPVSGVTFHFAPNFNGNASFLYQVRDPQSNTSAFGTVTIPVTAQNDAPLARNDFFTDVETTAPATRSIPLAHVLANDSDADNAVRPFNTGLNVTALSNPLGGTAVINGANVDFTYAAPNTPGDVGFDYTVSDGTVTATATVRWKLIAPVGVTPTAIIPEFQLGDTADNLRNYPATARLNDGSFVTVWNWDGNKDGNGNGIFGQRFAASGAKLGAQFQVDGGGVFNAAGTFSSQLFASVAPLADGGFVVAWQSFHDTGNSYDIWAQRFSSAGAFVGAPMLVNTTTADDQSDVAVAGTSSGFIVTWSSFTAATDYDVKARIYQTNGTPVTGEFTVNATSAGAQLGSSVATFSDGSAIVVWQSANQDGSGYGVYGQRVAANGTIVPATEFKVNTTTASDQFGPSVAVLSDGGFVVTWTTFDQDVVGTYGIYSQRYTSLGVASGGETVVNTTTAGDQMHPSVVGLSGGGYMVVWDNAGDVLGQRFNGSGALVGSEITVNETVVGGQAIGHRPGATLQTEAASDFSVAQLVNGTVVAVWYGPLGAETNVAFGRIFDFN